MYIEFQPNERNVGDLKVFNFNLQSHNPKTVLSNGNVGEFYAVLQIEPEIGDTEMDLYNFVTHIHNHIEAKMGTSFTVVLKSGNDPYTIFVTPNSLRPYRIFDGRNWVICEKKFEEFSDTLDNVVEECVSGLLLKG